MPHDDTIIKFVVKIYCKNLHKFCQKKELY